MWTRGRTLGVGGFATVSLAIVSRPSNDQSFNLPSLMAVKSAPLSKSFSLLRERRLLDVFEGSPYILRCFGADFTIEHGEPLYNLLLEYASGGSLADLVRSSGRGLPEGEVRRYAESVLMGLSFIHRQGFVHCDIKPDNILLVESDLSISALSSSRKRKRVEEITAKIADFGLARKAGQRPKGRATKRRLRGTPLYMAPESILYEEYEPHADIWALGCTVLQLITGKDPWKCDPDTETAAILHQIGFTEQVPEISSGLSKVAQDFLSKCLVRDPNSRWTADMLLGHSFVSALDGAFKNSIKNEGNRVFLSKAAKAVCDSLSQSSFDLPKPYLLMSRTVPDWPNSCIASRQSDVCASEDTGKFPACKFPAYKKLKRMEEEAEQGQSRASFQLDGLRRHWGIKRISVIPNSSIAIEIFT